ncbi:MAG: hypothetical protein DRP02_01955 [Candidatus Gerdarchaeota archaeon]|nr:MAG: hypothetical protein DRP02_01955 [Candidatus Gerdarchaeota archaeon]
MLFFMKNNKRTYILPEELREELKKPLGTLLVDMPTKALIEIVAESQPPCVVMVGDFCFHEAIKQKFIPTIAIIDGLNLRKPYQEFSIANATIIKAKNPPATITEDAWQAIKKAFKRQQKKKSRKTEKELTVLVIDGEEDLLVLPAVIEAPLNAIITYGQPYEGLVLIKVTTNVKLKCKKLTERMKVEKQ